MDKIRVGQDRVKKIEVNDEGEFIELNFNDRSFPHRFFGLIESFEKKEKEFLKKAKEIEEKECDTKEKDRAFLELDKEIHCFLMEQVDNVFGEDTCRKVFGDIVPAVECYKDFFEALMPYFKDYAKSVSENTKYNAKRTGSV